MTLVEVEKRYYQSLNRFKLIKVFKNDRVNRVVVRVKCEIEWNALSISLRSLS